MYFLATPLTIMTYYNEKKRTLPATFCHFWRRHGTWSPDYCGSVNIQTSVWTWRRPWRALALAQVSMRVGPSWWQVQPRSLSDLLAVINHSSGQHDAREPSWRDLRGGRAGREVEAWSEGALSKEGGLGISYGQLGPGETLATELIFESIRYNQAINMILNRAMIAEI